MERIIKFEFVERVKQLPNFGAEGSCTRLPERSTKKAAGYDFKKSQRWGSKFSLGS